MNPEQTTFTEVLRRAISKIKGDFSVRSLQPLADEHGVPHNHIAPYLRVFRDRGLLDVIRREPTARGGRMTTIYKRRGAMPKATGANGKIKYATAAPERHQRGLKCEDIGRCLTRLESVLNMVYHAQGVNVSA